MDYTKTIEEVKEVLSYQLAPELQDIKALKIMDIIIKAYQEGFDTASKICHESIQSTMNNFLHKPKIE